MAVFSLLILPLTMASPLATPSLGRNLLDMLEMMENQTNCGLLSLTGFASYGQTTGYSAVIAASCAYVHRSCCYVAKLTA